MRKRRRLLWIGGGHPGVVTQVVDGAASIDFRSRAAWKSMLAYSSAGLGLAAAHFEGPAVSARRHFGSNVARPVQSQRYPGKHVVERLTVRISLSVSRSR